MKPKARKTKAGWIVFDRVNIASGISLENAYAGWVCSGEFE